MQGNFSEAGVGFSVPVLVLEHYAKLLVSGVCSEHALKRTQYGEITSVTCQSKHKNWARSSTTLYVKFDQGYTWIFDLRLKKVNIKRYNDVKIKLTHEASRIVLICWNNLISYSPSKMSAK